VQTDGEDGNEAKKQRMPMPMPPIDRTRQLLSGGTKDGTHEAQHRSGNVTRPSDNIIADFIAMLIS
jgi:hypothetical protein